MGFARKPNFAPGQGFNYSNTNTVLLGLIIFGLFLVLILMAMTVLLFLLTRGGRFIYG